MPDFREEKIGLVIIRDIDNVGRIVIPRQFRDDLGINGGDAIEISVEGNAILLRKKVRRCVFCGTENNLKDCVLHGGSVCCDCFEHLRRID